MNRTVNLVAGHFSRLYARSGWSFAWRVWLEAEAVSFGIGLLLKCLFHLPRRADLDTYSIGRIFLGINVAGPLIETLLCQAIPIEIARFAGLAKSWQFLMSVVLFAAAHFYVSVTTGITAGIVLGSYFAFAYIRCRENSLPQAVFTTAAIHSSINLVTLAAIMWHRYNAID